MITNAMSDNYCQLSKTFARTARTTFVTVVNENINCDFLHLSTAGAYKQLICTHPVAVNCLDFYLRITIMQLIFSTAGLIPVRAERI